MKIESRASALYDGWIFHKLILPSGKCAASCITNPTTKDCANVETAIEYRRQGYMTYLINTLLSQNAFSYVQVRKDNYSAIKFYKKLGFIVEFEYKLKGVAMLCMAYPE